MRTASAFDVTLATVLALVLATGPVAAQDEPSPEGPLVTGEPYGVAVTPPIYLINFLFLYMASPDLGASMPAYRAPLPRALFECLEQNPAGCPYDEFASSFVAPTTPPTAAIGPPRRRSLALLDSGPEPRDACVWPAGCRETPEWESLAPPRFEHAGQIDEPLGAARAAQLARRLGMDDGMILSEDEYRCLMGTPPRTPDQEILFRCAQDLTNSSGSAVVPLSSYGLSISDAGEVRSNCAPDAPCLEFNALLAGPLEEIAFACGFLDKFTRMVTETPFLEFGVAGGPCQQGAEPACIVETTCAAGGAGASGCD